jgi:membrane protease YdiL (CAAX protease family)
LITFGGLDSEILKRKAFKYYPNFWQAVNLIVIYTFLQTIIDFPLAIIDYQNGTDWLQEPLLKFPVFFGTTFFILYLGYRYSGITLRELFPLKFFNWMILPLMLIALVSIQYFMNEVSLSVEKILPPPGWFLELFAKIFESDSGVMGGVLRVVVLAPIVEELIFRGVIYSGFSKNYKPFWAILFSALLFACFHLNPWQLGPTFLLGLFLGYVRYRTGSLLAAILGHALHNGMVYLSVVHYESIRKLSVMKPSNFDNYLLYIIILIGCLLGMYVLTAKGSWRKVK